MLQMMHSCMLDWHISLPHYDGMTACTQMASSLCVITQTHMEPTQEVSASSDAFSSRRAQAGSLDCNNSALLLYDIFCWHELVLLCGLYAMLCVR